MSDRFKEREDVVAEGASVDHSTSFGGAGNSGAASPSAADKRLPRRRGLFRRRPSLPPGRRIYAIGDIHGCFDLLQAILQQIELDNAGRDGAVPAEIVLLGDVIDRGPRSRDVLSALMIAQRQYHGVSVLLGNHEAALLDALTGDAAAQAGWLTFGGAATLASFDIAGPRAGEDPFDFADRLAAGIGDELIEWLGALPLTYEAGDFFFVHAGVRPGRRLARQERDDLLWIRGEFMNSDAWHGKVVVNGHSTVERIERRPNRISIDTGAYTTGILSAIGIEGDRVWELHT